MRLGDGKSWNFDDGLFTTGEGTDAKYNNGELIFTDNEIRTTGAAKLLLRTIDRVYVRDDSMRPCYSIYWWLE
jgi:hypothetical protein